jgi:hypothetical protein
MSWLKIFNSGYVKQGDLLEFRSSDGDAHIAFVAAAGKCLFEGRTFERPSAVWASLQVRY